MEANSNNNSPLRTILSVLVVGLDIILVLIALGFVIGLWELVS